MKELNSTKRGLSFGVQGLSSVNAGQRQVVYDPQLIVCSTEGSFRITPIISKLLNLESGDNICFLNNIDAIDLAIRDNNPDIVAFCEENNLELGSPEALLAIHKAFDMWAVYKGVREFDSKGNPKTCVERLTKDDRRKFVKANFNAMMDAVMASDKADVEPVKAALNAPGITEDKQIDILCPFVVAKELPKFTGSKVANPNKLTGTGVTLTFTDSNVWSQLKGDLGERANKVNRVFDIDVKNDIVDVPVNNGYETVMVKALVLGDYTDETVVARVANKAVDSED